MTTTRETVLQALFTRLQTITGAKVLRNEVLPEKIPASGLLIVRDGDTRLSNLDRMANQWKGGFAVILSLGAVAGVLIDQLVRFLFSRGG